MKRSKEGRQKKITKRFKNHKSKFKKIYEIFFLFPNWNINEIKQNLVRLSQFNRTISLAEPYG